MLLSICFYLLFAIQFASIIYFSLSREFELFETETEMFYLQLSMNDFSVHRIIGRGGFGEVYGCRKADTGKM